jgi:hypothetical protein
LTENVFFSKGSIVTLKDIEEKTLSQKETFNTSMTDEDGSSERLRAKMYRFRKISRHCTDVKSHLEWNALELMR